MGEVSRKLRREYWAGRDDGSGSENARWHQKVYEIHDPHDSQESTLGVDHIGIIGFCSDEGVRRNAGRVGAVNGPLALRKALSSLALHEPFASEEIKIFDYGDITYPDRQLEDGQEAVSKIVSHSLDTIGSKLTIVLGGGHETAWASYKGLSQSNYCSFDHEVRPLRFGVLNLDAHFDLRKEEVPTSGTPFLQISQAERKAGRDFSYAVLGVSESSNTTALFDEARRLGVRWMTDLECAEFGVEGVRRFIESFCEELDVLYLSIDLDLMPSSVAPGVSSPAALGVSPFLVVSAIHAAVATGKLKLMDIVELAPVLDSDDRTSKTAARLIDETVRAMFQ